MKNFYIQRANSLEEWIQAFLNLDKSICLYGLTKGIIGLYFIKTVGGGNVIASSEFYGK